MVPLDGGPSSEPKPIAGKNGTQITVEDLFYNTPSRLRTFRSGNDEFTKILDLLGRYGIHTKNVSFSCKKFGESSPSLSIRKELDTVERIRCIFGTTVSSSLISIDIPSKESIGLMGTKGYVSNVNYSSKKSIQPVFFINNRLVACDPLKKALVHLYSTYLPKGNHCFIYLNLDIIPGNLDVNIHPTKREVRFLYEEEIIETICEGVQAELSKSDMSRTFKVQTVLAGMKRTDGTRDEENNDKPTQDIGSAKKKRLAYKMVRVDSSQSRLTSMLNPNSRSQSQHQFNSRKFIASQDLTEEPQVDSIENDDNIEEESTNDLADDDSKIHYIKTSKPFTKVRLRSIKELRQLLESNIHSSLTEIFAKHVFIGVVYFNKRLAAIQYDVKLFLIDYGEICYRFFYQLGLSEFSNFGVIRLEESIPIKELLDVVYEEHEDPKVDVNKSLETIINMKEMLNEYFSISISDAGELETLPIMLKNYIPPLCKLPLFFFNLGTKIDWESEMECLRGMLEQLAILHVPINVEVKESSEQDKDETVTISNELENVIFPSIKKQFLATQEVADAVIEVANLPGLYKIFERC